LDIKTIKVSFSDKRGEITDIISKETIEHITIIRSEKGAIRGNHYHKETQQYLYIMSGCVQAVSQMPEGEKIIRTLHTGDLVSHKPDERHAFLALEETTWLVLTKGLRGGLDYEKDTYRLEEPLIK
jgi:quercetin dioxygenase-like cupin family protein